MSRKPVSRVSSGNPFADLAVPDADTRLAKAKLAQKITAVMREMNLTEMELAEMVGIAQPMVSMIARGELGPFSLDRLIELVKRLNMDIEIRVSPNPEAARSARTVVSYQEESDGLAASVDPAWSAGVRFT